MKRILALSAFAVLAFLLNLAPIPLFPGIHFIIGSAATMTVAVIAGPWWGALAGFVAAVPTLSYWSDPPALARYALEGWIVGYFARRYSPIVSAPLYWLLLGAPSVVLLTAARSSFALPSQSVLITMVAVCFKQLLNALIAATLAETVFVTPPARRLIRSWVPEAFLPPLSLRKLLLVLTMLAASIATLVLTAAGSREVGDLWRQRTDAVARQAASEAALAIQRRFVLGQQDPLGKGLQGDLEARLAGDASESIATFVVATTGGRVLAIAGQPLPPTLRRRLPLAGMQGLVSIPSHAAYEPTFLQELESVRAAYVTLPRAQWQVIAVIDRHALLTQVTRRLFFGWFLLLGILLGALMLAKLMTPVLAAPLDRLCRALHAVAEGDLTTRAQPEELHEVNALGLSFNRTTEQLEATVGDLKTANEKLQQAMGKLTDLDKVKWTFLNAVSHDLRIPLTSIVGYAEFLQEGLGGQLGADQRQFVDQILQSSDYMTRLLNELLDFARLEAGRFQVLPIAFEYAPFVADTVAKFGYQAERKGVSLVFEPPRAPITLEADPDRLTQVLNNLLSNAIKFTPEGGRITVRACLEGESVRTEVSDSGVGIPAEAIPHLFEQFYQTEEGKKAGGTGLGLPIVRTIVEAHGGTVGVESMPGKGSTLWFTLPLAPPAT